MKALRHISLLLTSLLALNCFQKASAQAYDFFYLGQAEGLPVDGIYDLLEDEHGALLIATEGGGLARFDGKKVQFWDHESSLGADTVRTIALAKNGGVWIGTDGHGLFHMHKETFTSIVPKELGHTEIRSLVEDHAGTLWIGTFNNGLFKLTANQLSTVDIAAETIRALHLSSDSTLMIGTDEGLFVQNENGFTLIDLEAQGGKSNRILTFFEDSQQQVWIGTDHGVIGFAGDNVLLPPIEFEYKRIKAIAEDQQGQIWLGTNAGAYEWDRSSNEVIKYTSSNGLSNDRIRKLYKDRSGSLWFGTYFGGVCQLKDQLTIRFTRDQGFPETSITHLELAPDSAVWFTNYENDVFRLGHDGSLKTIHSNLGRDVQSVLSGDASSILFRKGVSLLQQVSHTDTTFETVSFWSISLAMDEVLKSTPQSYYLAENHLSSRNQTLFNPDFACERLTTMVKDEKESRLFVGTSCGLFTIDLDEKGDFLLPEDMMTFLPLAGTESLNISCLTLDKRGNLWIGTERDGIYRFNQRIKHYSNRYLPDARITALALDDQQNLWVASRSGLTFIELDPSQEMVLNFQQYGVEEGIDAQINDLAWGLNGRLWLATSKGLEQVNPTGEFLNTRPPLLEITSIRLNYDPVNWDALGVKTNEGLPINLELAHSENHVTFDFNGIDLSQPDALIYQCFLEGFDLEWVDVTNLTSHTYQQLPPGEFTFKVRSRNSSGIWNDEPLSFAFSIQKPLYQEPWFLLLMLVAVIAMVYSFFQYRLRRLKKAKVILEQKVHQRTEELHEEKEKSERLLLNILPKDTADELKEKGYADTRNYDNASVLFSDFKGFTNLTEQMNSTELVKMLDSAFKAFDRNCDRYGVEKIKTIGDAYMCATGIPKSDGDHAQKLIEFAKAMIDEMNILNQANQSKGLPPWDIRIGIHSGPLIAGVVGEKKFAYDIWGDTVNLASRMESSGEPGRINLSESTYALIKDNYKCTARGKIKAKNKGELEMYFLEHE